MNSEHYVAPRQRRTVGKPFRKRSPLKKYAVILAVCSVAALAMHFLSEHSQQPTTEPAAAEGVQK